MVLLPGQLRLGPLRLPAYGVFAALGLIAALWLSLKTARLVGLEAEAVGDAGLFGVLAAFVISRILLVAGDPHGFIRMPLVMLSLPSFTYFGMVITAVVVVAYLQWKEIRLMRVLDAWAPCAAALVAMLSLGRFFEGADPGMPTTLRWGTVVPGSGGLMHLQPVQIYAALAAVVMLVVLMVMLERRLRTGVVAGVAFVAGGAVSFLLDMITQPVAIAGSAWLEPVQWIAVGEMLIGVAVLLYRPPLPLSREEAALVLEHFVLGGGTSYEHEILESMESKDPLLLEVRQRFLNLQTEFPPAERGTYCNEQGSQVLLDYARKLRNVEESTQRGPN
ncbi:MAG: prolipoprotein diacylglyceryl transferase family protein [Acidobacteriaceae bacterium]